MNALPPSGLHWIDYTIIALYVLGMLGLGYFYSRREGGTDDYFIGGGRLGSFVVGISLFATLMSTISYLSYPGEIVKHGPVILAGMLALPFSFVAVGYFLIPVYMKQRVTSAYQLLEARLGKGVRLLGASQFVVLRLVWMSLLVYMSARVLVVILNLGPQWQLPITLGIGVVAVVYTSLGGLRAVVTTDTVQFVLLLSGALVTVGLISYRTGGISAWWPQGWSPQWDDQPLFSLDPHVRVTVFGSILAQFVWNICTAGGDQTAIQRYMATNDAAAARRSFLVHNLANIVVLCLLALTGLALLGYFQAFPGLIPGSGSLSDEADYLFPSFVAGHLPVGLSGLVVAAMLAAAMSSLDSGVNSITAVVMTDFLGRRRRTNQLRTARWLALGIGTVVVLSSGLIEFVPGNFMEVAKKTANLLTTPIFALFFLAVFVPFATPLGAFAGTAYGIATAVTVGYWDVLTGQTAISFQWIGISALLANLAVACLVSAFDSLPIRRRWLTGAVASAPFLLVAALFYLR